MGFLKGKSSLMIYERWSNMRYQYRNREFWCKGYYLFAILFLMFDIETVFLFPWAAVVKDIGIYAFTSVSFFLVVLILGLAYAWKKGALEWK